MKQHQSILAIATDHLLLRHRHKTLVFLLWVLLVGGYLVYLWVNQLTAHSALDQLVILLETPWGPLLYITIFILSPLLFFSTALLAITGGCIFGAGSVENLLLSLLYTVIGSLGAAQVAYWMGSYLGADLLPARQNTLHRYADRMRDNSFMTVLVMHLLFLPYELVNYLAGMLRIRWGTFLLATFLGSLPGMLTFVPFGASLDIKQMLAGERPEISWQMLVFSFVVLVLSLGLARFLRHREDAL